MPHQYNQLQLARLVSRHRHRHVTVTVHILDQLFGCGDGELETPGRPRFDACITCVSIGTTHHMSLVSCVGRGPHNALRMHACMQRLLYCCAVYHWPRDIALLGRLGTTQTQQGRSPQPARQDISWIIIRIQRILVRFPFECSFEEKKKLRTRGVSSHSSSGSQPDLKATPAGSSIIH